MASEDSENDPSLRRELSLFDASAVVIGAIIGVGIFSRPARSPPRQGALPWPS